MKILTPFFVLTFILLFNCIIKAQQDSSVIKYFPEKNKNDSALIPFRTEQSDWFRNSEIPSFVFTSPGGKFSLGIGGFFNLTTSFDFDGITDNLDFVTYDIDVPKDSIQNSQYQMFANTSTLYFKVINKTSNGNLVGYVNANFRGPESTFSLFQVYVKYIGFELGQDWSTFVDLASFPTTVNYTGLNAMPEAVNTMIRYTKTFSKNWEFGIGAEMPDFSTSYANTISLKQNVPDIPVYLEYNFDESHVRLSGIYRNLLYRNDYLNENQTETGAAVSLTGNVDITKKAQIYFQGLYGKGIGNYVQDLSIDELNAVPVTGQPGQLAALPAYAYFGGLQYNFSKILFATIMYSQVKVMP
ncbi:MAG TPA: DcaP family trimeric outer membrane transporter, partial [Ignavibacteria bacterium]|nr:DcaP family trimeric outer membrane transporter [Ignavibacteria bacterium]HMR41953.1 DcaP family trimeric outer membrane transporter [Ignavibacteria bacterium]